MKKMTIAFLCFFGMQQLFAQQLQNYLPKNVSYNPAIPTPASVIGHEVGEWHVTHDKLVQYMYALDQASDRISLQEIGRTYEGRKQLVLIITSPKNHQQLANIQQKHVQWSENAKMAETANNDMPVVMLIGHSIHGNESSGSNASLLTAYYLAAATGDAIENTLQNAVILLDPSFNPDGLNRFATWVNMHKGQQLVSDPQSREFQEVWPGGRFNHYWFDLNRDWLPAQHVESQNRLAFYHQWKPNILTDHHEQGSNATFFFQPGVPSRVNPNTPEKNQVLTGLIGNFHARALDSIGSLYFTKEGYDDFYYGKGSTYPDINGSIGILFEQASSRGHLQETDNGLLSFPVTIRNQFVTALSTIQAGVAMRKELLTYQRGFYKESNKEAAAFGTKAFVFTEPNDKTRADKFTEMLLRHQIDVYALKQSVDIDGKRFEAAKAFLVPTNQTQFKLIKTIFERNLTYKDSLFYDVTAWTMPLAFGLQYAPLTQEAETLMGEKLTKAPLKNGMITGESTYAYLFEWNDLDAPKLLYALQQKGIICKVATQKLTAANGMSFGYGSIQVPVAIQNMDGVALYNILTAAVKNTNVTIHAVGSGLSVAGIDLGSNSWQLVKKPQVMVFTGAGTSALDVGEIWHMLDTRMQIPVSLIEVNRFGNIQTNRYNVMIMPSGSYNSFEKADYDKLRNWVQAGGTLIATEDATAILAKNGITKVIFKSTEEKRDTTLNLPYYLRSDEIRAKEMTGSIFEAKMDITHPVCWGYTQPSISIFKSNTLFMDQNNGPYDSPVMYTENPLQSGYIHKNYPSLIKNTAVVNIDVVGRGKVISMCDNVNFRAFWLGATKLMLNSIFFGDQIR